MKRERQSLELVAEALAKLEQLLESGSSLKSHCAEAGGKSLKEAQEALRELLRTHAPSALAAKVITERKVYSAEEDNRKRLNRDTQAVLNPSTHLYDNNVLRLYN